VAESSFDAWTKYYRQDENAPNAIVSYYAKGALIALALDLQLRAGTDGAASLDDVMRLLWQRHGRCAGDRITVHAFRRDELRSVSLQLAQPSINITSLAAKGRNALREAWLKPSTPIKAKKQRLG
jgi:predicted metalloprotease with PDZ domain